MDTNNKLRQDAHAVIIGINKYQDDKIPDLNFARADAEGIYQTLIDPELGRLPSANVILLLDEEATQRNIRSAIGTKLPRRAGENDVVYIYYAGHGSPVIDPKSRSRDGMEKYLVPADAELDDLFATGVSMNEIQTFFNRLESKQVLFFIDSCYSGEAGGRSFQNSAFRGRHILSTDFLEELAGEGRLVITACDVNEVSLEAAHLGHGLFTHYLMEGVKGIADKDRDGAVSVHELYEYVYENVSQHARKLGGSMHPIQKGSIKGKIVLTQYETEAQKQAKALHLQAQSLFDAEKFDAAYKLWQAVLKLVPEHEPANFGMAMIQGIREKAREEKRKALPPKPKALPSESSTLMKALNLMNGVKLFKKNAAPKENGAAPIRLSIADEDTALVRLEGKSIAERLRASIRVSLRTLLIAVAAALVLSAAMLYAVLHFQESGKIGVLSKYTIVIYFLENDPELSKTANEIKAGLVGYGFRDRLILPQEVSAAFLKSVAPPKGNEIRYQIDEVEAATQLKGVLKEIDLTKTFATRVAQGRDKQDAISIFLAAPSLDNPGAKN